MGRLIRLDRTGHTELAEWTTGDSATQRAAAESFERELERGMFASVATPEGESVVVRELPVDADLVVLRRPIVGG